MYRTLPQLLIAAMLFAVAACPDDEVATDPIEFGPAVAAPVDDEITVLPVAGLSSEVFPYIDPVAVGFEFGGIVRSSGALEGYVLDGEAWEPGVYLIFASESYFAPTQEDQESEESCIAWGWWSPTHPAALAAYDGATFYSDFEGTLNLKGHNCHELLDPAVHGEEGEDFIDRFDGMRLGIGFAPVTAALTGQWSQETLDDWGPSMLATYVAVYGPEGDFVAQDVSTTFAIGVDPGTGDVSTDAEGDLATLDVAGVAVADGLPDMYALTISNYYLLLEGLDLSALK